ncbi:ABC transporter substrate-binding protein [Polyangium aurulentum]|uniref:ABC transporter substrate-binding protein n=1 Tax=Polyangium aurulentum TaxID=2567896 RepID=UPI0010AE84E9|nr:ABC transporter substrate-binding protein [Polyangium aurulentum]UQA56481.1 ABC transporter substrate-binding protein [Polyangium aurulentum]
MDASKRANVVKESRRTRRLGGALGVAAVALGIAAFAPSCSVIVDTNANQCSEDEVASCPAGRICSGGVCVEQPKCSTTSECTASSGDFNICRKDPGQTQGQCVALKSKECQTIEGDYTADNVFLIGSIHPTTATGGDGEVGIAMENSIRLAVQEVRETSNGLPPVAGQMGNRTVVMIGCSDEGLEDKSVAAAKHLVNNLGVQAIIGGAFSGIAIKTATEVTIPNEVLFITASGTSTVLTGLPDKPQGSNVGLVWRTVPSDLYQARAISLYVPQLEAATRVELGLAPGAPVKLAILYKGDAYGRELKNAVQSDLVLNGKKAIDNDMANFIAIDYGNPDDPDSDPINFGGAISKAKTMGAHIVLLFGTGEAVKDIYGPLEIGWDPGLGHHPRYVFSDANYGTAIATKINDSENDPVKRADWRRRTTGVVPGPQDDDTLYKIYRSAYTSSLEGDPTIFGAASAYDAAHLLFYSAASIQDGVLSGRNLALGMTKMSSADPAEAVVEAGTAKLGEALGNLANGTYKSIDYVGAFGSLDFDEATNEPEADVQIFCLADDGSGKATTLLSGAYYDSETGALAGTISPDCQ